jgi:exosortase
MTPRARTSLFALYSLVVAAAHVSVLAGLVEYSQRDMSASHLVAIPFVSTALIYRNRHNLTAALRWGIGSGVALCAAALIVRLWAETSLPQDAHDSRLSAAVLSVVLLWAGGFVLFFGTGAARRSLFALAFLFLTIPIPTAALDALVYVLKVGSTETVAALFSLTGTPYFREEFVFNLPNLAIEIADECSGIRSTIALTLTMLLAGHAFLTTFWARALLLAFVVPVTILKNAIRIVSISLLSIHVDPSFITGRLHHDGGVVFFLIALALITPLLTVLRKAEPIRRSAAAPTAPSMADVR